MIRGTRMLFGKEARALLDVTVQLRRCVEMAGFEPVIVSSLTDPDLFRYQIGDNRMWEFRDLADRPVALIPEVTALLRKEFRESWSRNQPKPLKLWYLQRCYRYDRPQRGRWREFWQFGVEFMPATDATVQPFLLSLLQRCLRVCGLKDFEVRPSEERGQGYYTGAGFEVWRDGLQIAGGGPYLEGNGFAIGVDRLLLVRDGSEDPKQLAEKLAIPDGEAKVPDVLEGSS